MLQYIKASTWERVEFFGGHESIWADRIAKIGVWAHVH